MGVTPINVLSDNGVTQVYYCGKSENGATVVKSETTLVLLPEVVVEHGHIDALTCNNAHLVIRACID